MSAVEKKIPSYTYALIYYMSKMVFDRVENLETNINWDECVEAYFFGAEGELHIHSGDDGLLAHEFIEKDDMCIVKRKYYIEQNKFKTMGKTVTVCEYLEPDDDGQMCVVYKRLYAK